MQFGILGSGSWATAIAKILTDNGHQIHWWIRNTATIDHFHKRSHNPHYLSSVYFNQAQLQLYADVNEWAAAADTWIIAVPSAYVESALAPVSGNLFAGKKIISAVTGILPSQTRLLNQYLAAQYGVPGTDYFALLGPCHAEEVAAEKLSYLTFSGLDVTATEKIAECFRNEYINTVVNTDIQGVQYAAVLKNIYALGAGIAHGLEYGDNFQSVYIANSANEMMGFLRKLARSEAKEPSDNYAASVYLGDLLVTCYSLYSRNRTFGNMIGKGYSVKSAQLELNMVAEGYNASKCIHLLNQSIGADMPIANAIYAMLWEGLPAAEGFQQIEKGLV
ncbi:MAG TPA: NAD(P)H-dependent glycerol-3-phosphate dehydrogenase [Sediminibacterium sp.]|nr:NAD(P)H-dependent glycerol-3-phosphate dehydrogenase [Sediminibacterium sp.]